MFLTLDTVEDKGVKAVALAERKPHVEQLAPVELAPVAALLRHQHAVP